MKKIIVAVVLALIVAGAGFMLMKNRFVGMQFMSGSSQDKDLMIFNDSPDVISVEYKLGDKNVAFTLPPNEKITGGTGFIRIFTGKAGSYELTYPFPRPEGSVQEVSISQIVDAAKTESMTDALYIKKGMLGDVSVVYEEVRQLV